MIGVKLLNGKLHGEGIVIKSNGAKYEGEYDLG